MIELKQWQFAPYGIIDDVLSRTTDPLKYSPYAAQSIVRGNPATISNEQRVQIEETLVRKMWDRERTEGTTLWTTGGVKRGIKLMDGSSPDENTIVGFDRTESTDQK